VRNNERCSAADAYLTPAKDRPNLQVVTHALVTRVLIHKGVTQGVEYLTAEGLQRHHASQEVLLSAGAINSPQILMLSGVGPAETLRQHCIAVQVDLPGVGRNLQDHLAPRIRCTTTVEHSFPALSDEQKKAALAEYQESRTGPLTSNFVEVGGFVRLSDEEACPGLQLFFSPSLHSDYPEGPIQQSHGMTVSTYVARPKSRGQVKLATASPFDKALIDPNYLADDYDVEGSVAGLKWCRRILAAKAFDGVRGTELLPERDIQDDAGLAELAALGQRDAPRRVVDRLFGREVVSAAANARRSLTASGPGRSSIPGHDAVSGGKHLNSVNAPVGNRLLACT
jgi:choline dehydrogenase